MKKSVHKLRLAAFKCNITLVVCTLYDKFSKKNHLARLGLQDAWFGAKRKLILAWVKRIDKDQTKFCNFVYCLENVF